MKVKAIVSGRTKTVNGDWVDIYNYRIIDVPDEKLLNQIGYAATNEIYDACEEAWEIMSLNRSYEIAEPGLAKDIPFLEYPFETVDEMRRFLSRPDVIAEYE